MGFIKPEVLTASSLRLYSCIGGDVRKMKEYARAFYHSAAWKKCRAAYAKSARGLCEVCLQRGLFTPGVIVHHKEHINPDNITDTRVLLDWNNLQLVCRDCHADIHKDSYGPKKRENRRYIIAEDGRVIIGD